MALKPTNNVSWGPISQFDMIQLYSPYDPIGEWFSVRCPEHGGDYIQFKMSVMPDKSIEEYATEIIYEKCIRCVSARQTIASIWPEGAEL